MVQRNYSSLLVQSEKLINSEDYPAAMALLEEALTQILDKKRTEVLTEKQTDVLSNREYQCANMLLEAYIRTKAYDRIEKVIEKYLTENEAEAGRFDYRLLYEYYLSGKRFDRARGIIDKLASDYIRLMFKVSRYCQDETADFVTMKLYDDMIREYYELEIDSVAACTDEDKKALAVKTEAFYQKYGNIESVQPKELYGNILIYTLADIRGYHFKHEKTKRDILECSDVFEEFDEEDASFDTERKILRTQADGLYDCIKDMLEVLELAFVLGDKENIRYYGGIFWYTLRKKFPVKDNDEKKIIKKYIEDFPSEKLNSYCNIVIYLSCVGKTDTAKGLLEYIKPETSKLKRCQYGCKNCECHKRYEAMGMYYLASGDEEKAMEYFGECVRTGARYRVANYMVNKA